MSIGCRSIKIYSQLYFLIDINISSKFSIYCIELPNKQSFIEICLVLINLSKLFTDEKNLNLFPLKFFY